MATKASSFLQQAAAYDPKKKREEAEQTSQNNQSKASSFLQQAAAYTPKETTQPKNTISFGGRNYATNGPTRSQIKQYGEELGQQIARDAASSASRQTQMYIPKDLLNTTVEDNYLKGTDVPIDSERGKRLSQLQDNAKYAQAIVSDYENYDNARRYRDELTPEQQERLSTEYKAAKEYLAGAGAQADELLRYNSDEEYQSYLDMLENAMRDQQRRDALDPIEAAYQLDELKRQKAELERIYASTSADNAMTDLSAVLGDRKKRLDAIDAQIKQLEGDLVARQNETRYAQIMRLPDFEQSSQYIPHERISGTSLTDPSGEGLYKQPALQYEAVNGNKTAINQYNRATNNSGNWDGLAYMTDDERRIYNYFYNRDMQSEDSLVRDDPEMHGESGAYINEIMPTLNARMRSALEEDMRKYAGEHPFAASLASVLMSPLKAASFASQLGEYAATGEIDPNASGSAYAYLNSATRAEVSHMVERKWGKPGSFAYQTGMSVADNLWQMVLTGGSAGEGAMLAIMGTGAAADSVLAAKERGLSDGQAIALGITSGAIEAVTERIGLDALYDGIKGGRPALIAILRSTLAEGSEEVLGTFLDDIADMIITGTDSERMKRIAELKAQGMSDSEAAGQAFVELLKEAGTAGLSGALSGLLMSGGAQALMKSYSAIVNRNAAGQNAETATPTPTTVEEYQRIFEEAAAQNDTVAPVAAEGTSIPVQETTDTTEAENAAQPVLEPQTEPVAPTVTPELQREAMAAMQESVSNSFGKAGAEAAMSAYDPQGAVGMNDYLRDFARTYNAALEGGTATDTVLTANQYNAAIQAANADRAEVLQNAAPESTIRTEVTPAKLAQYEALQATDVEQNDYYDTIESAEQIRTYQEAVEAERESFGSMPDFDLQDAEEALRSGEITVYATRTIRGGTYVTPSRSMAEDASRGGRVLSTTVPLDSVAWIDPYQGIYAPVQEGMTNGREERNDVVGTGSAGNVSQRTGESTRAVSEGSEGARGERGAGSQTAQAEQGIGGAAAQTQRVDAKELLVEAASGQTVEIQTEPDENTRNAFALAKKNGIRAKAFKGEIKITTKDGTIRAYYNPNTGEIGFQSDNPYVAGEDLARHEIMERFLATGRVRISDVVTRAANILGPDGMNLLQQAVNVYYDAWAKNKTLTAAESRTLREHAASELVCDGADHINQLRLSVDAGNTEYAENADLLDTVLDALNEAANELTGNAFVLDGNGTRYSTKAESTKTYEGVSLTEDSEAYSYDFMISQPDMIVAEMPALSSVKNGKNISQEKAVKKGLENAKTLGRVLDNGDIVVKNGYTGREITIGKSGLEHGLNGENVSRLRTNARLAAIGGEIVKNAIPVNSLTNNKTQVFGTYAMAALLRSGERHVVAIVTVEQRKNSVDNIDYVDVTHAINGRLEKENSRRSSTREPDFNTSATPTVSISIADFLKIVNTTHRSILSDDVLQHFGETRPKDGYYTGRTKFSSQLPVEGTFQALYDTLPDGRIKAKNAADLSTEDWSIIQKAVKKLGYEVRSAKDAKAIYGEYVAEHGFNKEQSEAIMAAYGVSDKKANTANPAREAAAKKEFGMTSNFREAGYLLRDGRMLDFSGKKEGGPANVRYMDHREIARVFSENEGPSSDNRYGDNTWYMNQFIGEGNIRLMESQGVTIGEMEPTDKQYSILKQFVDHVLKDEGYFYLDLSNNDGFTVESRDYGENDSASKIINDIKAYFKNGELPYRSSLAAFFSSSIIDPEPSAAPSPEALAQKINNAGLHLTSKDNNKNNLRIRAWIKENYPELYDRVEFVNDKMTGVVEVKSINAETSAAKAARLAEEYAKQKAANEAVVAENKKYGVEYGEEEAGRSGLVRSYENRDAVATAVQTALEKLPGVESVDTHLSRGVGSYETFYTTVYMEDEDSDPIEFRFSDHSSRYGGASVYLWNNAYKAVPELIDDMTRIVNGEDAERVIQERHARAAPSRFSSALSPEALEQQNEKLTQDLKRITAELAKAQNKAAYWEGQTKPSPAPTPNSTDINRLASYIVNTNATELKAKDLAPALTEMAEFIMRGGNERDELTYSGVKSRALDIAHRVLENYSELLDSNAVRDYKEIRKRIRDWGTIQVPGNDLPPDWTDFKRRNRWLRLAVSTGTSLDLIYTDLSRSYPWFFPEDANPGSDQLYALIDGVRAAEPAYWNPNNEVMAEASEYLANQIIDALVNGYVDDLGKTVEMPIRQDKTYADRMQKKLFDQRYDAQQKLDAQRAQFTEAIRETRARADQRLADLKAHYAEVKANAKQRKTEGAMRTRLLKIANRLADKKLPTPSRALVNEYIGVLDTVAKNMTGKTRDKLQALSELYNDALENNPDFVRDEAIEKKLARLHAVRIADMSIEQVQDLTDVLLGLEHQFNNEKRELESADRRDVYQKGLQIIDDIQGGRTVKPQYLEKLDNLFVRNTLSPLRELHRQTGYVDGDPLYDAAQRLNRGQLRMNDYVMRSSKAFDQWVQDTKLMEGLTGKKAKTIKIRGTGMNGEAVTVEITPDMRISLYLHNKNLQNQQHIGSLSGGIKVPDMKLYRQGKIAEAYAKGTRIRLQPSEISAICANMTAQERALAERVYKYFNTTSREALGEVHETLKGYPMRFVEDYFPIDTDGNFTKASSENIAFDGSLEGSGWLKERVVNAKNPIMLYDATSVLLKSIQAHGQFIGLAIPIRDFNKLYGMSGPKYDESGTRVGSQSVKETLRSLWGTGATDYIDKMLGDLQKTHTESNSWTDLFRQLRSNYAGATLALNLSVAMKQAGSYPTAAAVLGWKPLARALADFGKVDLEAIADVTPLQWLRSQGYSTPELGDLKAKGRQLPKALNWIQGMDLATTRKLWKACEYYMEYNHPDMKRGSAEYKQTISELYNRTIEETQPNYTTMQRPQLLRSNNELLRDISMFKTQLFQNFNILYDAFGNMAAKHQQYNANPNEETKQRYDEAKKAAGRAVSSQIVQAVVIAAVTLGWNALRGKLRRYKDEDKDKITGASFAKRFGLDVASGFFGMVPFGSEVFSMISSLLTDEKFYGFEGVSVGALTDFASTLLSAVDQIGKSLEASQSGSTAEIQKQVLAWEDIAESTAKVFGVPAENVMNLIKGVYGNVTKTACGKYYGEYLSMLATTPIASNKGKYYDVLYAAQESGNMDQFWQIYDSLVELDAMASATKSTAENIEAALKQRAKKAG